MPLSKITRLLLAVAAIPLVLGGCGDSSKTAGVAFETVPEYVERHSVTGGGRPVKLVLENDTLSVSLSGSPWIARYDLRMKRLDSIPLTSPEPVVPTSFAYADSLLLVTDHARGMVLVYDRAGELKASFGTLPDGVTPLMPFSIAFFGGVAYVGDVGQRKVLAVSLTDAPGITEQGELILTIPGDSTHLVGFPLSVMVTPDGRLLAGDASDGKVKAYTCDGRYVYDFDSMPSNQTPAPQGFAYDDVPDPAMQDTSTFDPSGVRLQGRIHVPDATNGNIHMFNSLGKYVASYPSDSSLVRPSGIAVDVGNNRIYVADSGTGDIVVFRYRE